jgi:hypothetical protein
MSKGKQTYGVSLKETTIDYLNDDVKGFKAFEDKVDLLNINLSKPITKNVYINEIRDTGERSEINFGGLD